jgi:hypothetical protein
MSEEIINKHRKIGGKNTEGEKDKEIEPKIKTE